MAQYKQHQVFYKIIFNTVVSEYVHVHHGDRFSYDVPGRTTKLYLEEH